MAKEKAETELNAGAAVADRYDDDVQSDMWQKYEKLYKQILPRIVEEGREPSNAEVTWCQANVAWNYKRLKAELRTTRAVMEACLRAGDSAKRAQQQEVREAAEKRDRIEGGKLDKEIERLQEQRNALRKEVGRCVRQSEGIQQSLEFLSNPQVLPEHVRSEWENATRYYKRTLRKQRDRTQVDLREIDLLLSPGFGGRSQEDYLGYVQRYNRSFARRDENGQLQATEAFEKARPELEGKRQQLRQELDKLEAACGEEEQRLSRMLEFWWG